MNSAANGWRSMISFPRMAPGIAIPLAVAGAATAPAIFVLASLAAPYGETIRHVAATRGADYFFTTALLCVSVGVVAGALGVAAALLTALCDFPFRRPLSFALALPLATPAYLAAYAYADLLGPFGALSLVSEFIAAAGLPSIRSLPGAIFVLALTLYPYVFLTAHAALTSRSTAMIDAARTLGATPAAAVRKLMLPAVRPAIAGGVALIMMETAAEFGVADYFGVPTLSVGIFRTWHGFGDLAAASQLASALFLFAALFVALEAASRRGRDGDAPRISARATRFRLRGLSEFLAAAFCLGLIVLGFLAPAAVYAAKLAPWDWSGVHGGFFGALSNSLSIAAAGALVTLAVAVMLAYSARAGRTRFMKALIRAATLGYATPGAVIAIGILAVFSAAGAASAGAAALIYAYLARFLTAGYNATAGGLAQIDAGLDDAARSLGAPTRRILVAIHAPLIRPSLLAAATIVFVDIVKELPATLILRDFNFETLATRVYRLAGDERIFEAAPDALMLIAFGALPIILLKAFSDRVDPFRRPGAGA